MGYGAGFVVVGDTVMASLLYPLDDKEDKVRIREGIATGRMTLSRKTLLTRPICLPGKKVYLNE